MGRKRKIVTEEVEDSFDSIEGVIRAIRKAKKIIVITGAGISVSCGIPDFRSRDVGLYNNLDCSSIDIPSAELLFDMEYFKIDPAPFFKFCSTLIPKPEVMPSLSHCFISALEKKKKLLRNYTQNIDGLERKIGISDSKLIECHGSMSKFRCVACRKQLSLCEVVDDVNNHQIIYCKCGNVMKPTVTFFGENVPEAFNRAIHIDSPKCDLILVIGTSLKVGGSVVSLLTNTKHVPHILINRDIIASPKSVGKNFDAVLLGDCDSITKYLCDSLGWNDIAINYDTNQNDWQISSEKIGEHTYKIFKSARPICESLNYSSQVIEEVQDVHSASRSKRQKKSKRAL